ncbi:MAG TPA: DUF1552 domain-containing protein [Polyangiaceae bacterium]|jgi:hypothetical protein|nr:DUF1552 domain-containing protein [Polyangiaceae bacterium]
MTLSLSRRAFLSGLGVAAASPFVPILNASGQEALSPKRLILFYTPHGTVKNAWTPTGSATNFTLSPILKPLERHQKKICVLSGINMQDVGVGAPHTKGLPLVWTASKLIEDMTFTRADGSGGMYFGWNSSASIDQVIATKLAPPTPYKSLEFGVRSGGSNPASRMIYADAQKPLAPATDPYSQFTRLFAMPNVQATSERLSAVDIMKAELARMRPRIASEERPKVDAHVDAIASIEKRLRSKAVACAGPTTGAKIDPNQIANTPTIIDLQCSLIASAFACDLTRFASLQYSIGDNDGYPYPWLGITDGHHDLTHAGDDDTVAWGKVTQIHTWYADRFANLLDLLDAIPEANGKTVLDNSFVVWGSELGKGNTHSFKSTPFVVAGGASAAFATGRYLEFNEQLDHNRLLVSICHAFGLTDVDTFGNTDVGHGPLPGFLT